MTDNPVVVRPIRPGERNAALDLKCQVWPQLILANEQRRWDWEFSANPAFDPERRTTLVLEQGHNLVGLFSLIPHRVQLGSRIGLACDGVDFCVSEACRGLGLSRLLVDRWMRAETCDFAFTTTPSEVAIHVMLGCGGTLLGSTNEQVAYAWFVAGEHGDAPDKPAHQVQQVLGFDEEWDQLWERIRSQQRLLLLRDARYLNWRYRDFPFEQPILLQSRDDLGNISGVAVVQHDRDCNRLYVCDLLCDLENDPARRGLLRRAVEIANSSGLETLFLATRCPRQARTVQEEGFQPVQDVYPKFLGRVNRSLEQPPVVIEDWYAALGDGDQLYNVGEPKSEDHG